MKALVDYESDGNSELDYSSSESPEEAPEQPQCLPDVDAILRETRAEMEQARLKADQLICRFAEAYVDTAGQFREASIARYRERLEGLPAEVCAKVCETLAKDDIFCCNMEFGNGHLSFGGMSFTYKVESDSAFNALSHHAWKDLHRLYMKHESPPLSGNTLEEGRSYMAHLAHSDDEENGLDPPRERSPSSSEESDSSSGEEGFPSSGYSTGTSGATGRESRRHSASPSPEWTTDDEAGSSGTPKKRGPGRPPKKRGVGRPRKHQEDSDAPEKRGPGRPPKSKPWSADEEALIRKKMAKERQRQGDRILRSKTILKLLEHFPGRTRNALKNKWQDMNRKDRKNDSEGTGQNSGFLDGKAQGRVRSSDVNRRHEEDLGLLMPYDNGDEGTFDDREVEGQRYSLAPKNSTWTPERDRLLLNRMKSETQSGGVTAMSVPLAVQKELAKLFNVNERTIVRRWQSISEHRTSTGNEERRKKKKKDKSNLTHILGKSQPKIVENAPESSPRLQLSDAAEDSEAVEASGSWHTSRPSNAASWSAQEVEALIRLTKGANSTGDVDFEDVAARLPSSTTRTVKACRIYWQRHVQSLQRDQDRNPTPETEVPEQGADIGGRFDIAEGSRKGEKRASDPSRGSASHKRLKAKKGSPKAKHHQPKMLSNRNLWSRDEDELLWRVALTNIPWPDVAAHLPNRSTSACQVRYTVHLANKPEYKERLNGQPGRSIRRRVDPKPDPGSDGESPDEADTVIWGDRGSKHGRDSDDESEKQSAARGKRHRGALQRSPPRGRDSDEGSEPEAQDSDELMHEFE